jgi:pimeloyl-ACP methyl ester carboxylesterase
VIIPKFIKVTFPILITSYVCICTFVYAIQDSFIYYPQPKTVSSPDSTIVLPVTSANIIITTKQHPGSKAIIYFGGNGEDVSLNLPTFDTTFPDHAIYLMHYRGYGGSSGNPSEEAIYNDAVKLYKTVIKEHSDISIIGRSLGTGIATRLVSYFPVSHLVLVTPYDSIVEIASNIFPYLPVSILLRDKYESGKYAENINIPTTILMAENDQIIPKESTEMLYSRFPDDVATLVTINNVGHNSISNSPDYLLTLRKSLTDEGNKN